MRNYIETIPAKREQDEAGVHIKELQWQLFIWRLYKMAIICVNFYQVSLPNVFGENIELKHQYFFHGEIARKGRRFTDV